MITKSFKRIIIVSFLVLSIVASPRFVNALTVLKCYRYSYTENYTIDTKVFPPLVTLREVVTPGGIYKYYFLNNAGSKPLFVQYKDYFQTKVKFVDNKVYNKPSDETSWFNRTDISNSSNWNSLYNLARIENKIPSPTIYNSNTKPAPLASIPFFFTIEYDGQFTNITGTLSYIMLEHDCSSGEVVIAEKSDLQEINKTSTLESVDTSSQVTSGDIQPKKSFLTMIRKFFLFFKFW